MKYRKKEIPVSDVRRYLEPGPVILLSSEYKGLKNIMTLNWHMVMENEPSLVGCYIWDQNHTHNMVLKSRQCVINIPEAHMGKTVVDIGNTTGRDIDKFSEFNLTPLPAQLVNAPLIEQCYANFQCKLIDSSLVKKYHLFIFEVVKAQVAVTPKFPQPMHYRGEGLFMIAGPTISKYRKHFRPGMI